MTHGPMRHKELRQLTDANDQALSLALKELLDYSIVNRHQYNEMPLKVVYSLTEIGLFHFCHIKTIILMTGC